MKRIILHIRTKFVTTDNALRVNPTMIESYCKDGDKPGSQVFFTGGRPATPVEESPEVIDELIDEAMASKTVSLDGIAK